MQKLMVLVTAALLLSACGKKSAKDYKNHEGVQSIRKIYDGARAYYMDAPVGRGGAMGGMGLQPPRLAELSLRLQVTCSRAVSVTTILSMTARLD